MIFIDKAEQYISNVSKNQTQPFIEPGTMKRVQRGGSFLCNDQYCERYIAGSRGKGEVSSGSNNLGFRCVSDDPAPKK